MTKNELPILERFWSAVGGTLILEFPLVKQTKFSHIRRTDGLLLPDGPRRQVMWSRYKADENTTMEQVVEGSNIVVVQVKPHGLDLHLLGQTFFAVELLKKLNPASIRGVALCTREDAALKEVFEAYPNMDVAVDKS